MLKNDSIIRIDEFMEDYISYNVALEYIKASDNMKQVCLMLTNAKNGGDIRKCVYVLNLDRDDNRFDVEHQANKTALKFSSDPKTIMRNMYSTKDMFYKSAIYDKGKSLRNDTTYDFKNIFSHNLSKPYSDVVQVDNTLYSSTELSPYGHINITCDSYLYLAIDNNDMTLPDIKIETCLYDKNMISAVLSGDVDARISTVLSTFTGVKYNTMLEIPGNIQNEFDSGNIAANAFKGKNLYNSLFDMDHQAGVGNNLDHARSYLKIDNCNNQVYLKYYDNLEYSPNLSVEPEGKNIELSGHTTDLKFGNSKHMYLNIETIDYIGRYANKYGHKSNLYSIVTKTNLFSSNDIKEETKEYLKNDIKSFIKSITKKMMPAHTLLFEVTVK